MTMRNEERGFWTGALLALLFLPSLRALLSTSFYESLATLRLNTTALWTLALLAPVLSPILPTRALRPTLALAAVTAALVPVARFTPRYLPLAALASALALVALGLAARYVGALAGAVCGLAVDGALLLVGHSVEPVDGTAAAGALALIGTAALVASWKLAPEASARGGALAGIAIGAFLSVEIAFLANPFALARWAGLPAWGAALGSLGGLAIGATVLRQAPLWVWIAGALGLADLAFLRSPVAGLSAALLQVALGAAAARLAGRATGRLAPVGLAASFAPAMFLLVFFRSPLGAGEWSGIVPLLALVAMIPGIAAGRAGVRLRAGGGATTAALAVLILVAASPTPLPEPSESEVLTLVSWNVHQGFGNRRALDPALYADVLRSLAPDVVVLQESDTARVSSGGLDIVRYLADALGMRAAYGRSGVAVLSRFPFAEVDATHATRERDWFFEAALDVDKTTLWIHGTHLARSRDERAAQTQELLAAAELRAGPRILAGDFNSCPTPTCFSSRPSEPVYDTLTQRYADAWVSAGHAREDPAGNTHPAWAPARRIDLVLVEDVEVVDAGPMLDERTRLGSDHLPNIVRIRLAPERN